MPLVGDIAKAEENALSWHKSKGELIKNTWQGIPVLDFKPKSKDGYYYKSKHTKRKIVLHFTMGYLGGDLSTLTRDSSYVSVSFVVARSGAIIKLFDPDYWSYHLGKNARGGNGNMSKESIAIELSNIGPVEKSGNWMWNTYGSKYCKVSETQHYIDLKTKYRGFRYYANFTDAQYKSTEKLVAKLAAEYSIPKTFLGGTDRFDLFKNSADAIQYRGICSHVNFRGPGEKTDIGPAFDWDAIGA